MESSRNEHQSKAKWRETIVARRNSLTTEERFFENQALIEATAVRNFTGIVCAYVPFGAEPGSLDWLDSLKKRCEKLLLPITSSGALDWAEYEGRDSLSRGLLPGLWEPTGPPLGSSAITEAATLLIPALAVDQAGVRLGRGAGYYDRSLVLAAAEAELIAVVRDDELVPVLPVESHDVLMTAVLTPSRGITALPQE